MQNFTITLDNHNLIKIRQRLKEYQSKKPSNPHLLYFYKVNGHTISIFTSHVMLIQGAKPKECYEWIVNNGLLIESQKKIISKSTKPASIENYVGCDETGVGDYFGGLVTCAVYLKKSKEQALMQLGVCDSKDLTDTQMINLVNKLKTLCDYECSILSPTEYNKLVSKYQNTHIVKAYLHDQTIKKLVKRLKLDESTTIVMDQFAPRNTYYAYFDKIGVNPYQITHFETKAENKYLAVAAASIIGRVAFLEQIRELSKRAHMPLLLGASNPKIIDQARKIYLDGGKNQLSTFVKIDFATTKKIL